MANGNKKKALQLLPGKKLKGYNNNLSIGISTRATEFVHLSNSSSNHLRD
jgi:hypothetical protein